MAWVKERARAFLVCWRDERGRERSQSFRFNPEDPDLDSSDPDWSFCMGRERARALAERFRAQKTATERRSMNAVDRLPPTERLFAEGWSKPEYMFENYLRSIIETDRELKPSSKDTYLHSLRNHIEVTGPLSSVHLL